MGRGARRLYRVSQGDEVDVHCAQYFVNSSLAPVLLFRRRRKSVADVLQGIGMHGFTQSRWDALLRYWGAVCRHSPCGPISTFIPGVIGFLLNCMASVRGVFDSLESLPNFTRKVVANQGGIMGCVGGPIGSGRIWGQALCLASA